MTLAYLFWGNIARQAGTAKTRLKQNEMKLLSWLVDSLPGIYMLKSATHLRPTRPIVNDALTDAGCEGINR